MDTLRRIPLFQALSDQQIQRIREIARFEHYGGGDTVFERGDEGRDFFILEEGAVDVVMRHAGKHDTVSRLHAVTIFGEVGLLAKSVRSATVVSVEDSEMLRVDNDAFQALLEEDAPMAAVFYRSLAQMLFNRLSLTTKLVTLHKLDLNQ